MNKAFAQTTIRERKSSEYGMPLSLFHTLRSIFHFGYYPCPLKGEEGRLGLVWGFHNGLTTDWDWNTFINPPFGTKKGEKVGDWIRKMQVESSKYMKCVYVMLLPTRLESNWFQDLIWADGQSQVYVMRGRLKFYSPKNNPKNNPHPIGSMLVFRSHSILDTQFRLLEKNVPGIWIKGGEY